MKNLILGYKRGWNKWECLSRALKSIGQEVDVVIKDFDKIEGPYDRIFTVAESLLPIQAKLEQLYGLTNVSTEAADVLSDKKKMDDFCMTIGLQHLIPYSVIPTSPEHLDYWDDKPFIIKPVIGSGGKAENLNYIFFKNKKEFIESEDTLFFDKNKTGWKDSRFNNSINHYMVQDKLPDEAELWGPYYYVNESGVLKNLLWVRGKCREGRNVEFMSFDKKDVPKDIVYESNNFFERVVATLRLKNMFFSGPDFYKWNNNIKMIDCNPRIGQGLQQIDDVHNNTIVPKILQNKTFSYDKQIYWVLSNLKPGTIKSVSDISHIKYLSKANWELKPGMIIPKVQHICMSGFRQAFVIEGTNESDMRKTYQTINKQLQDCITYSTE
jgi:hypothetical protein